MKFFCGENLVCTDVIYLAAIWC